MDWTQLNNLAEDYGMIVIVVASLVSLGLVLKKIWPGVSNFVRFIDAIIEVPANAALTSQRLSALEEKVDILVPPVGVPTRKPPTGSSASR